MNRFAVLTVCTANICRSPTMEILLRARLDADRFEVASSGVRGWHAAPVDSMVALELARLGYSAPSFRSRALDVHQIEAASLILTAARDHRAEVLALSPRALRKTFTLREFAALVDGVESQSSRTPSLEDLVADASRRRSTAPADIDVQDPFRRDPGVHREVADQISEAIDVVGAALARLPLRASVARRS